MGKPYGASTDWVAAIGSPPGNRVRQQLWAEELLWGHWFLEAPCLYPLKPHRVLPNNPKKLFCFVFSMFLAEKNQVQWDWPVNNIIVKQPDWEPNPGIVGATVFSCLNLPLSQRETLRLPGPFRNLSSPGWGASLNSHFLVQNRDHFYFPESPAPFRGISHCPAWKLKRLSRKIQNTLCLKNLLHV